MASILRSSKFVRYIAGFARNVVLNTPREFDGNLVNTTQCLCGALPRSFASQIPAQNDQSLETSLRRLDQDVRKIGRISRRDIEDVLEEIRNSRSATSSQSLLVIRCCGNLVPEELPEVRTKLVQEIWATLHKLNVPMDISHYNALLRVYLENEHPFSPTEFLADLESKGIEPNRVTYQRLIARYCQVGDIEGATKILEFMKEKQLPVNENVFNALIVGHSQTGDMDSAQGILSVMTQAGLEPSADTYTTLLCGYGKKGDMEAITRILEECETKEILLLDKDYLDIVYALGTNGHVEHIPLILSKVRRAIGYNQDAINLILRLINKKQEDAAFLVLETVVRSTNVDGTLAQVGHFFVKQLVKANTSVEKIVELCKRLEEKGMYNKALSLAAETSLELGNDKLAYPLLTELSKGDIPVRQHYFWPLIVAKAKDESGRGIVEVLLQMHKFGVIPTTETVKEYVIPNLKGSSSQILATLRTANVSLGVSGACLVHHLLNKNDIKEAAVMSSQIAAFYNPDLMRRPLTGAFYKTGDLDSYIRIIRNIHDNLDRMKRNDDEETGSNSVDKNEVVGNLILDLGINQRQFLSVIENVLRALIAEGLSISTTAAEKLQDKLGEKMTEDISSLLGKLTSGDLTPVPVPKKLPSYTPSHQMNVEQLERLVHNLEAKNQETKGLKRQLLTLYYREKNLEKTEAILAELENQSSFTYSPGIYAQLADLYAYHGNLDKAMFYYNKLKEIETIDFKMDESKTITIAQLLVRERKFDEAISLIENTPRDSKQEERNFTYSAQVWRFLNSLADEGKVDELNTLFDTLVRKEFIEPNNILLGPLIKVHIVRKEIDQALEKFEWCVNQFRATPWKNELACQLIQSEDAEKLQKLTDLSTSVHGEINSLYDLVFAFVECGRVRQARKILETPGLQNRPQRINNRCERYRQEGNVKPLEGLKDATKDLDHINRNDIYFQLLLSYIKQDEVDKALGLWTQMQEEDLLPTDEFLVNLGKFLQEKGVTVPFIIPDVVQPPPPQETRPSLQMFRRKLRAGDVDAALQYYNPNDNSFSITDTSQLIEKLIQHDRIGEATKVTLHLLERNMTPITRVFKFLLNKLANAGDLDSLGVINRKVSQEVKRNISFDNRYCHANLVAGRAQQYLDTLEKEIDTAKDEDLRTIEEKFPRGGAYGILERHPELIDKYENLAIKYGQRGIVAPLNVLWTNYFITGNDVKAEEIWTKYLKDAPRIMFQRIVHAARDSQDEALIKKLIEHLKSSNVTEGAVGNAYSCLLDVQVAKNNPEEIVSTFEAAIKDAGLLHINRTAILRVKEVYEQLGKPFDYTIPPKNPKSMSSTSTTSSSEEVKK